MKNIFLYIDEALNEKTFLIHNTLVIYLNFDMMELALMYYMAEAAKCALRNHISMKSSIWSFWKSHNLLITQFCEITKQTRLMATNKTYDH